MRIHASQQTGFKRAHGNEADPPQTEGSWYARFATPDIEWLAVKPSLRLLVVVGWRSRGVSRWLSTLGILQLEALIRLRECS